MINYIFFGLVALSFIGLLLLLKSNREQKKLIKKELQAIKTLRIEGRSNVKGKLR